MKYCKKYDDENDYDDMPFDAQVGDQLHQHVDDYDHDDKFYEYDDDSFHAHDDSFYESDDHENVYEIQDSIV